MGHVFFTSGGSESADSALRLARAYHVARGPPRAVEGHRPPPELPRHDARRAGRRQPQRPAGRLRAAAARLPQGAVGRRRRRGRGDRAGGPDDDRRRSSSSRSPAPPAPASTPSDEYWRAVEDVCRRHDILLIADEVMTGFGRTGRRWGHEHFPIAPDVLYGGKGLGGGYVPIGHGRRDRRGRRAAARAAGSCSSRSPAATRCAPAPRAVLDDPRARAPRRALARRWATCSATASHDALGDHPARRRHPRPRPVPRRRAARRAAARLDGQAVVARVPGPRHVDLPGRLGPGARRRDDRLPVHRSPRPRSSCSSSASPPPIDAAAPADRRPTGIRVRVPPVHDGTTGVGMPSSADAVYSRRTSGTSSPSGRCSTRTSKPRRRRQRPPLHVRRARTRANRTANALRGARCAAGRPRRRCC